MRFTEYRVVVWMSLLVFSLLVGCGDRSERAVYIPPDSNGIRLEDRQILVDLDPESVWEHLMSVPEISGWKLDSYDLEAGRIYYRIATEHPSTYVYGGQYFARGSDIEQEYMVFLETEHAPELVALAEIIVEESKAGQTKVTVDARYHLTLPGVTMFVEDLGEEVTFDDTDWIFRSGNYSNVRIQRPTGGAGPHRKVVATGNFESTILDVLK